MGALTFDALLRSLKQGGRGGVGGLRGGGWDGPGGVGGGGGTAAALGAVYYLHGDEDVLKEEAVRALVDRALDPGARDFNFEQRRAGDLDSEAFHSLVNTPPMLAAARVVVIRRIVGLRKTSR